MIHPQNATETTASAVKLIEHVFDCICIVRTYDEQIVFPAVTDAAFDENGGELHSVGRCPSVEFELFEVTGKCTRSVVVVVVFDVLDHRVYDGFALGWDHQFVAVPIVTDFCIREHLHELDPLVHRPVAQVIAHRRRVRIFRVPLGHVANASTGQVGLIWVAMPLSKKPDRNLAMELVRVTESAALAASKWVGRGDKNAADGAAVDAMRNLLDTVNMDGVVVIGEGEKDEAPMLFNGEHVGNGNKPVTDVAVDPIDGTTLTSLGRGNALSVIAVAERGSMFNPGPFVYMNKIAVGPDARGAIDITKSVRHNLDSIARAKHKTLNELTIIVLDRPRHNDLVGEIRSAGCRIKLISDGDIFGAIAAAWPQTGVDALMGIGGTPEGVTSAAAIKALGGEIQGLLWARGEEDRALAKAAGIDMNRVLTTDDLVHCDDAFFAATGVTDGDLLRGVRYDTYGATSQSLVMRVRSGTIRTIDTRHRADRIGQYSSLEFR